MKRNPHYRLINILLFGSIFYIVYYPSIQQSSAIQFLIKFLTVRASREWLEVATLLMGLGGIFVLAFKTHKWDRFRSGLGTDWPVYLIVIFLYLLHRNQNLPEQQWTFASFSFLQQLKYADVVFFFTLVLAFQPAKTNPPGRELKNRLLEDNFHSQRGQDVYARNGYAAHIANLVKRQQTENAFALGITGKWGSGKTVFLRQIAAYLGESSAILINFNPWLTKDPALMTEDFFSLMINNTKEYANQLSQNIRKYAHALLSIEDNFKVKISKLVGTDTTVTLETLRENIHNAIIGNNLKLIVFIDDLDRLNGKEILAVMTIIRNSFNFPNVFFIVAYDHDYIVSQLEGEKIRPAEKYLEKIFAMEIDLPSFPISVLKPQLQLLLSADKNQLIASEIKVALDKIESITSFDYIAQNLRECVRLANAFNHIFDKKISEVDLTDYLLLEILKSRRRRLYQDLKNALTGNYRPAFLSFPAGEVPGPIKFLPDIYTKLSNSIIGKEDEAALEFLFNRSDFDAVKSIRIRENALRYFSDHLFGNISFEAFDVYKSDKDSQKFRQTISAMLKEGKKAELKNLFQRTTAVSSQQAMFNFCEGIFHFSSLQNDTDILRNASEIISNNVHVFADSKEFGSFVENLLETDYYPGIRAQVIHQLILSNQLNRYVEKSFDEQPIISRLRKYLERYTLDKTKYTWEWFEIFKATLDRQQVPDPESLRMVNAYIKRFPPEFLQSTDIQGQPDARYLDAYIEKYLGWPAFRELLYSSKEDLHILRLKSFYRRFEANGFSPINAQLPVLYIFSDVDTMFDGSPGYPQYESGPAVISERLNTIHGQINNPDIRNARWITHHNKIPLDEQLKGGVYSFTRVFNLGEPIGDFTAQLLVMFDDEVKIVLNGQPLGTFKSHENKVPLKAITITERLIFDADNVLLFEVKNKSAEKPPPDYDPNIEFNPCGLLYSVKILSHNARELFQTHAGNTIV